jgi:phosphoribosylformylglycinamidine cyclo-ligase
VSAKKKSAGTLSYADAGVDIAAAEDSKGRIKRHVESTFTAGTRGAFGGFGGMFRVPEGM